MERRVTVNDRIERLELEPAEEFDSEPESAAPEAPPASQGPCLHLGSSGQRCSRPAVAGGYCARHHPDPEFRTSGSARNYTRVMVATVALIIVVWPYLADAIREFMRWLADLR